MKRPGWGTSAGATVVSFRLFSSRHQPSRDPGRRPQFKAPAFNPVAGRFDDTIILGRVELPSDPAWAESTGDVGMTSSTTVGKGQIRKKRSLGWPAAGSRNRRSAHLFVRGKTGRTKSPVRQIEWEGNRCGSVLRALHAPPFSSLFLSAVQGKTDCEARDGGMK